MAQKASKKPSTKQKTAAAKKRTQPNKKTPNTLSKKAAAQKQKAVLLKIKATVFIAVCVVLLFGFFYADQAERFINFNVFGSTISTEIATDGLKVHFMDVGQADAIAIEFPNGKTMLIDSGLGNTTSSMHTYLTSNVFTNGKALVFDYFLLTHSDADHAGGAKFVFENYVVNNIYRPKIYTLQEQEEAELTGVAVHNTLTYQNFVNYANNELDENQNPSQIVFSEVNLQIIEEEVSILFLSPLSNYYGPQKFNEHSPILLLEYKEKRIMLTGDATVQNEQEVLANLGGYYYDIDVLKLGHHGSKTSTSDEFIKAFTPEYIIISVGSKSKYGHPSDSVLDILAQNGILSHKIYTTFEHGTIVVGVSENEQSEVVLAIVSGYTPEKPWIEWWQFSLAVALAVGAALFATELQHLKAKAKKIA